ncbi:MAG TPA: fused MFS/spermidine synthase, partial [Pyrinomonadaceae bacterium]
GSPAVWNTCMLFFQTMLLVGYLYALALSGWLGLRVQVAVHLLFITAIAVYLFTSASHSPALTAVQQENPTRWLLENLLFSVGLPFFILSATSPLLQSWFSKLQHRLAVDPYFLFAASNAGSLIALLAFPFVLEPSLVLNQQYQLWRAGFVVLAALTCVIAFALKLVGPVHTNATHEPRAENRANETSDRLPVLRRLRWIALSFVPSSLMLGVTTYITADVGAVPLLWVIPLALYLLTFVLAFSRKQFVSAALLNRLLIMGALVVTLILASGATEPAWVLILANLGFFFVAALMCHSQLANDRPSVTHLPEYYLWIAVGGALGSFFNVLIAPVLFTSVLEYPLAIVLACMLRPTNSRPGDRINNYFDVIYPVGLYLLTVGLAILVTYLRIGFSILNLFVVLGIPLIIINHFFRERPVRFALSLSAVMLASVYYTGHTDRTLHVVRNFFGTTRVTTDSAQKINTWYSGNTVHGRQFVDPSRRCEPLSYHHELGPLGQIMAVFNAAPANQRVAVIGLGVGAMGAYSKPGQEWTFYEINPDVIDLARNSQYFTYLQNCMKGTPIVIEGDARLSLQNAPDDHFGLIVFDAFSSDAIPVHLVTQQALDLYLSKLAPGGILVFHVSNRSLNLKPILADLAASRNLISIGFDDLKPSSLEGKDPSQWVVMARSGPEISNLSINSQWQPLKGTSGGRVWTDDFSNILRAIRWQ